MAELAILQTAVTAALVVVVAELPATEFSGTEIQTVETLEVTAAMAATSPEVTVELTPEVEAEEDLTITLTTKEEKEVQEL